MLLTLFATGHNIIPLYSSQSTMEVTMAAKKKAKKAPKKAKKAKKR
jgi:hypothetical protein